VTVRAKQIAFFYFDEQNGPRPQQITFAQRENFIGGVTMVELQSGDALIVTAVEAPAAAQVHKNTLAFKPRFLLPHPVAFVRH